MTKSLVFESENEVIAAAVKFMEERATYKGDPLSSPAQSRKILQLMIGDRESEVFTVLFLDSQHHLIKSEEMFRGTIDGSAVYPREVVKSALSFNAAAVIFGHNHPSGVVEPSAADKRITERLTNALALIDVKVLDHLIVAPDTSYSFAEAGLM